MTPAPSAFIEFRMLMAEKLILWSLHLMPKRHPDTGIWAKHIEAAALETAE